MVEDVGDDDLRKLSRGGHDYRKVYAAFEAARAHTGQPTVILAHTVKGWTLEVLRGPQRHPPDEEADDRPTCKAFRDRLYLPITDKQLEADLPPYYHPGEKSDEIQYMKERRAALGGALPQAGGAGQAADAAARRQGLRRVPRRLGQAAGRDDHGLRPAVQGPDEGQGDRQAVRADHPRRGPDVRPRRDLPDRQDLLAARAGVRGRRPRDAAVLQGVDDRADPARGDLRGRLDGLADRGVGRTPPTARR